MDLQNLTKKNQEFIHIATKQLIQDGKTDTEIKNILETVLPDIYENQKNSIPARSFLGAPTDWASQFTKTPEEEKIAKQEKKNTNPWLMWIDSSLFWLGFLGVITGILGLFNENAQTYGLLTLIIVGLGGGAVLYATYHFIYRHAGKEKSQRPSFIKSIIALAIMIVLWILLFSVTSILPTTINPQLPPIVLIIIGAIAFAIRYYIKKKYNILSVMSAQANAKRFGKNG